MTAKTCGCKDRGMRVAYTFVQTYHTLCLDKKDILVAEIEACEHLWNYATESRDKEAAGKELVELRMTLDLMT
jgi:hypothetical protein